MRDGDATLMELFDSVPADLERYFTQTVDGSLGAIEEPGINLLSIADAVRWTKDFQQFHPTVRLLGGVILDDPNTSNHHIYLSAPACCGSVLYLDHDGDSQIVFPALGDFSNAARSAQRRGCDVTAFHPECAVLLRDQPALSCLISELYDQRNECDSLDVVISLIPSMDLTDVDLLERLAADDDFFVAEAIGNSIAARPRPNLERIATICENHRHVQASVAGARALAAIRKLK